MATPFDLNQTDRLLTTTRAVRRRLDVTRPLPRELLLECLDIALQAPTGGNSQGWRWLIVEDAERKQKLAEFYLEGFRPYAEARNLHADGGQAPDSDALAVSAWSLAEKLADVPAIVIPCLLDAPGPGATNATLAGTYASIYPAAWSFMLALRSRGVGSTLTTLHLARERDAGALLGVPDTALQACMIPCAHYTGSDFRPAKRIPARDVTYFDSWGETSKR